MKKNVQFIPNLAKDQHISMVKNQNLTFIEQKDIRKAKQTLKRIQEIQSLNMVSFEIECLIQSIEQIISKK